MYECSIVEMIRCEILSSHAHDDINYAKEKYPVLILMIQIFFKSLSS